MPETQYYPSHVSDYAPVSFKLRNHLMAIISKVKRYSSWDEDSPNTCPTLLRETSKAVLQGRIPSYVSYKKKKDRIRTSLQIIELEITNHYRRKPLNWSWTINKKLCFLLICLILYMWNITAIQANVWKVWSNKTKRRRKREMIQLMIITKNCTP